MDSIATTSEAVLSAVLGFLAWLGIHPSLRDLVKALILVVFVLIILMIVGDVYRGEIQNKLHRIILAPSAKGASLPSDQRTALEARRRLRKEKDQVCHLPQYLVPLTMNDTFSNVLFYFRYRDATGRIRSKKIETYRVRFHVKKIANSSALAVGHEGDHQYTPEEEELFQDQDGVTIVTMAGSRVDYIELGKIAPIMEKEVTRYHTLQKGGIGQMIAKMGNSEVREPRALGLAVKFHFPIDPHFLLYKHPDTNVRTTAWLTVLTSVFALFMQLIYSGGTDTATAAAPVQERAAIVQHTSPN
ncbi:MAG: hypothetical protein ABL871_12355 [Terricaulis sp.]